MVIASGCVILVVIWTLLAYRVIPLPLQDPLSAWLRRQWLLEGIVILACVSVLSLAWSRRRSVEALWIPWWRAWCVFLAWAAVSVVYSVDVGASMRSWIGWLAFGLVAYTVAVLSRSPRDLKLWVTFLAGCAVVVCLEGLWQYVVSFRITLPLMEQFQKTGELPLNGWHAHVVKDFLTRQRIISVFGWPNLLAGYLLLMAPVAGGVAFQTSTIAGRLGWGLATVLMTACLILTLSMGSWVAAIMTGCLACWLLRTPLRGTGSGRRMKMGRLSWAISIGLLISLVVCVSGFMLVRRSRPFITSSVVSRVVYVRGALEVLRTHPFGGTGVGTFGISYQALKPREQFEDQHTTIHAHNSLLEIGAELGLVGVAVFLVFLWQVARLIVRAMGPGEPGAPRRIHQGLALGLMGFFIHSLLEQTFVEAVTAPFWWVVLGLLTAGVSKRPHPEPIRRLDRWILHRVPVLGSGLGLLIAWRVTMGDLWAAQAVTSWFQAKPQETQHALERAQHWNPIESHYPLDQGERLLSLIPSQPTESVPVLLTQAQHQFERAVDRSPWSGHAWLRLGQIRWRLGEFEGALTALRAAVRYHPNSRTAFTSLAGLVYGMGRFEELRQVGLQFQRLEPSSPDGYLWEAIGWEGQGSVQQAFDRYQALLARAPQHPRALLHMARLLHRQGASSEAAFYYDAFLRVMSEPCAECQEARDFLKSHESTRTTVDSE